MDAWAVRELASTRRYGPRSVAVGVTATPRCNVVQYIECEVEAEERRREAKLTMGKTSRGMHPNRVGLQQCFGGGSSGMRDPDHDNREPPRALDKHRLGAC